MRYLIVLLLVACGGSGGTDDGGMPDAMPFDAAFDGGTGMLDSGPRHDAGAMCGECESPPPAECSDATTVLEYARTGECVDGTCEYRTREVECELPEASCVDGVATSYAEAGCVEGECVATPIEVTCSNGCCDDGCCEVTPSNGDELGGLGTSMLTLEPPDGTTFNTDTGCEGITAIGECVAVDVFDAPDVCVCRSQRLRIGGTLKVIGTRALALFASETILVRGLLDASADGSVSGPGAAFEYIDAASGQNGGAGGSFGTRGAGASVDAYGNEELVPLLGGMSGEGSCGGRDGGGGGGALQLSAGVDIEVTGVIDVSGGGGTGGVESTVCNGGAGGGSGGAVLIEAPEVEITGTVVANGGGGGAAGMDERFGSRGGDGTRSGGGIGGDATDCGCALYGYTNGGDGGRGASASTAATLGEAPDSENRCLGTCVVGGGGDGGGLGRVRVNTATGCLCGGTFSPAVSFGSITVD